MNVAQKKKGGVTLTNGELPTTSPDDPPIYSSTELAQVLHGNWYHDGFFNEAKDLVLVRPKFIKEDVWKTWSPNSADLSKNVINTGWDDTNLLRKSLRPYRNQMFPQKIFDQNTGEIIVPQVRL